MTNPLTERVARAICKMRGVNSDQPMPNGIFGDAPAWEFFVADAQAAIEAYEKWQKDNNLVLLSQKSVARAICLANGKDPDAVDYKGKAQWEEHKADAQAAIEAEKVK